MDRTSVILPQIQCCREPYEVARDADAVLILTEWEEFRQLDWERIHGLMARPLVLDGRNLLEPKAMMERGFEYHSFGQPVETVRAQLVPAQIPKVSEASVSA